MGKRCGPQGGEERGENCVFKKMELRVISENVMFKKKMANGDSCMKGGY